MTAGHWILIAVTVVILLSLAVAGWTTCYDDKSCVWEKRR